MAHSVTIKACDRIGGLQISFETSDRINILNFYPSDEETLGIVKRGLERLAGQGKIDEDLRTMCRCVGDL